MRSIFTAVALALISSQGAYAMNCELLQLKSWSAKTDGDFVEITQEISNAGKRSFTMVEGATVYSDPLGRQVLALRLDEDFALSAGSSTTTTGYLGSEERIAKLAPTDVKGSICVTSILWDDGTKEAF